MAVEATLDADPGSVAQRDPESHPAGTPRRRVPDLLLLVGLSLVVRLVAMWGRGDYVAYDEGWYLLLGRNLWQGEGFSLAGLRHVTLSPLFPVLAGAVDAVIGNAVWAGRLVAALASALLVVPCWFIFRRLDDRRAAVLGCAFVAALPALAAFGVPEWTGWELFVGAEPLFHLLLFCGIAIFLRALDRPAWRSWVAAGVVFALAYLARSEGILLFGLTGLGGAAVVAAQRRWRLVPGLALCALAFALAAAPYWLYLHDVVGRWTLTGRSVDVSVSIPAPDQPEREAASAGVIERMLWRGDTDYGRRLYALHPSATRMASGYWGVPESPSSPVAVPAPGPEGAERAGPADVAPAAPASPAAAAPEATTGADAGAASPGLLSLYGRSLGLLVPVYLWPLILLGALRIGRRSWSEDLLVTTSLALASVGIAAVVAADPRTQAFILPLFALCAARGALLLGGLAERRASALRPGFVAGVIGVLLLVPMLAETARRTYLGVTLAVDHQVIGTELRLVGEGLRRIVAPDETVVSFHPAAAVWARRDWRPLPWARLPEIVRYASLNEGRFLVLGGHNPSPVKASDLPREYAVVRLPGGELPIREWAVQPTMLTPLFALAVLGPAAEPAGAGAPGRPRVPLSDPGVQGVR